MRSSHSFHLFSSLALWRRSVSSSDRSYAVFIWAVSAVFLLLSGCGRPHQPVDKPVLAVSIEPLRYFVEQIAGDRYRVVSVVPVGFSPETYEPAPEQLLAVSEAKLYFKVGQLGFETTWLNRICENNPHLLLVDTSDSLDASAGNAHAQLLDPHTWTSCRNAEQISRCVCAALCRLDSLGRDTYQERLQQLVKNIHQTDRQVRQLLQNLRYRTFVTAHPAYTYFALEYGLKQLSIERNGKEPAPGELADFVRQCRQEDVKVILVQPEFNKESARVLAKEMGAEVKDVQPLNYDWHQEMLKVATLLKTAGEQASGVLNSRLDDDK